MNGQTDSKIYLIYNNKSDLRILSPFVTFFISFNECCIICRLETCRNPNPHGWEMCQLLDILKTEEVLH